MRRWVTAFSSVVIALSFMTASASARPAPSFGARLQLTSKVAPCSGTLTVTWRNAGENQILWTADSGNTGTLVLTTGGVQYQPPQTAGKLQEPFTLTGSGAVDVTFNNGGKVVTIMVTC